MKSLFKIIFAIIVLFGVSSCERNEAIDSLSNARTLKLTVEAIENNSATTRVTDGTTVIENEVKNIWVLEFDEDDACVGVTYHSDYASFEPAISASATTVWVIANTFSTSLFTTTNCATLSKFNELYFELDDNDYRESDMWETDSGVNYLRMSGSWSGSTGSEVLIGLTPLAAKITLTYSCPDNSEDSWVEITSLQLNNVPKQCYYSGETSSSGVTSYQLYTLDANTDSGSYTFYMPQNKQGTNDNTSASEKTNDAPTNASYIEIVGTYCTYDNLTEALDDEESGDDVTYDKTVVSTPVIIYLYPGANNYNDYNVEQGVNYNLTCTISCDYDSWESDSRVVTTAPELPSEGLFLHYEFDSDNVSLNSAYDDDYTTLIAAYEGSEHTITADCQEYNNDAAGKILRNLAGDDTYNCTSIWDRSYSFGNGSAYMSYTQGDDYLEAKDVLIDTNWGEGLSPSDVSFTLVYIASTESDGSEILYGTNTNSDRWYMHNSGGQLKYGLQGIQTTAIPDFIVAPDEVILIFDMCNNTNKSRQVYCNNVLYKELTFTDFEFTKNMNVFGHWASSSDPTTGKLRLFLMYDRQLDIDEINQIKTYATLKGLI